MKFTREIPKKTGWYWVLLKNYYDDFPHIPIYLSDESVYLFIGYLNVWDEDVPIEYDFLQLGEDSGEGIENVLAWSDKPIEGPPENYDADLLHEGKNGLVLHD